MQLPPYAQAKLVYCVQGRILDVAVDVKKKILLLLVSLLLWNSPRKTDGNYLCQKVFCMGILYFQKTVLVRYKCDDFYNKESECGIHPLDNTVNIDWRIPAEQQSISEKDLNAIYFLELPEIIL